MKNSIKIVREKQNLSQQDLAFRMNIRISTLNNIETLTTYRPSGLLMLKLANFFKMTVEDIFSLEENEQKCKVHHTTGFPRRNVALKNLIR